MCLLLLGMIELTVQPLTAIVLDRSLTIRNPVVCESPILVLFFGYRVELVTLQCGPPSAIPVLIPLEFQDLRDSMQGRERTRRHLVDDNESYDVIQGQTRIESLWKNYPLEGDVFEGVAKGWYTNDLVWPEVLH